MTGPGAPRADRLAELLRENELDALLVTNLVNVRYLTGFTGTNGACLVGSGGLRAFLTDFRYVEQAERQVAGFERRRGRADLLGDVGDLLAEGEVRRLGFEDHDLTVHRHGRLREQLVNELELIPAGTLVERLRTVKEPGELEAIRAAAALADAVLHWIRDGGFRGRTERGAARAIEDELRAQGGEPAFDTIVAAGANGALPHATPGDAPIPPGTLVVVDLGAKLDGYCSDCTRTFATGELTDRARATYELVREAQERALAATVPGASCKQVDGVARGVIEQAGHGEHFGHGLGHGVGLEIHEGPRLTQTADESERLVEGNVVTVEPGVYLPGEVGVRIEDLVVVTGGEPEVLSPFPKGLTTVEP